jgi:hypothetical protein
MKKRLAAVLATVMVMSAITPAVYAEEATAGSTPDNPVEFSYEDIDATVYDGAWFETGLGFDVYLPEDWEEVEITDEMAGAGLMFMAGEPGGGANIAITATEIPAEQVDTYDIGQLGEELAASTSTAMYADLSGIPAVIFENEEAKTSGFSTVAAGYVITGVISAPSDDQYEEFAPYFMNILTSVSLTPEEDSTAESAESAAE